MTTSVFADTIRQTAVDKIDLLFMIDNSASMSDKQDILRLAVPDLVNRLANPICVDAEGRQAQAANGRCPNGMSREFRPIPDIHVGVVSSSLGDVGAGAACAAGENVDMAHLIGSLERGRGSGANQSGFLAWNPSVDLESFNASFQRMVSAVGERGCGLEASLESWYRFLIDPLPYQRLERVKCRETDTLTNCVRPVRDAAGGVAVDEALLEQRQAFLRPDSLVAIIMLSDENDCSLRVGGSTWVVANTGQNMLRASAACESNPNDACCYPCITGAPAGCGADPSCAEQPGIHAANLLARADDSANLRCFDQKRRFGFDFLYPTDRYVNALTQGKLCWSNPTLASEGCPEALQVNPLFAGGRDPGLVFLGGIVGVPWQALARDTDTDGRALGQTELLYKSARDLGDSDWQALLGTRASTDSPGTAPTNPYMVESTAPRPSVPRGNLINGREYDTSQRESDMSQGRPIGVPSDLQYACISPLPEARACDKAHPERCDCDATIHDSPLCEQRPGDPSTPAGATQYWAKAYPGLRELQVLKDFGENSIPASICARNVSDDTRPDFGYRPAIAAIVERLKEKLADRCLPRRLVPDEDRSVPCTLIEVRPGTGAGCACDPAVAREALDAEERSQALERLASDKTSPCGLNDPSCNDTCLCKVLQVNEVPGQGQAELDACQNNTTAAGIEGWCYVAASEDQKIGNAEIVARCPATERRALRFVGEGLASNSITLIDCTGSSLVSEGY